MYLLDHSRNFIIAEDLFDINENDMYKNVIQLLSKDLTSLNELCSKISMNIAAINSSEDLKRDYHHITNSLLCQILFGMVVVARFNGMNIDAASTRFNNLLAKSARTTVPANSLSNVLSVQFISCESSGGNGINFLYKNDKSLLCDIIYIINTLDAIGDPICKIWKKVNDVAMQNPANKEQSRGWIRQ